MVKRASSRKVIKKLSSHAAALLLCLALASSLFSAQLSQSKYVLNTTQYTISMASKITTAITSIGAIIGIAEVNQTLTAGALMPADATVLYQWQRCATADGLYTDIVGETGSTYILVAEDSNNYIRISATGMGEYSGFVNSVTGPVTAPDALKTIEEKISSKAEIGLDADASDLITAIDPSTDTTEVVSDTEPLDPSTVIAPITDTSEVVPEDEPVEPSTVIVPSPDTSEAVPETETVEPSIIIAPSTDATEVVPEAEAVEPSIIIAPSTDATEVVPEAEAVEPSIIIAPSTDATEVVPETEAVEPSTVIAPSSDAIEAVPEAEAVEPSTVIVSSPDTSEVVPEAEPVYPSTAINTISGIVQVGQTLTAGALTTADATASYQWQSCDTADGVYIDIIDATENTYTLQASDYNYYIRVMTTSSDIDAGAAASACVGPVTAATISISAISVQVPETNDTPQTSTIETDQYIATITWDTATGSTDNSVVHTATITMTALSGYTQTGITANFFTVAGATTTTNTIDSGVITAVFFPALS